MWHAIIPHIKGDKTKKRYKDIADTLVEDINRLHNEIKMVSSALKAYASCSCKNLLRKAGKATKKPEEIIIKLRNYNKKSKGTGKNLWKSITSMIQNEEVKKRFERMADEIENDIEQMHDNFKMLRPILMALDNVMKDQKTNQPSQQKCMPFIRKREGH